MSRKNDDFIGLLIELPWWVSIAIGAAFYIGLRFVVPTITFDNPILNGLPRSDRR